jgi:AraC-like DNA-binding protein
VNKYRILDVEKAIQEKQYHTKTLLGIALDCGFSSKSTFNRAFRKLKGISPSDFAKQ